VAITAAKKNREGRVRKPVMAAFVLLSIVIVGIEFVFDLKRNFLWYRAVLLFDISLIATYFSLILLRIVGARHRFLELVRNNKADLAYLVVICAFLFLPRLAAALIIVRLSLSMLVRLLETSAGARVVNVLNFRPSQTLALSFLGLISLGAILLTFPAATVDGKGAKLIDAIFTMTAASCVAGLTVMDIGLEFSRFGQGVILFGMQAGGLGIMVLSAAFTILVGGTIPSRRQAGLSEVLDISTPEGLKSLIRSVTATTVVIEFFGALSLFLLCSDEVPRFTERVWWSIFHTVSAFCNCGLGLFSDSMMLFVDRPSVCIVFMALITSGGLGFFVFSDLTSREVWAVKKPRAIWARLQIQSKVVIISTVLLNAFGMLVFLFFEYDGVLRGLTIDNKIVAALFQTVNLRSAGFSSVPFGSLAGPTIMFCIAYMFIGAGPGSTGGGIKVTTAAISVMAVRAMLRGRQDVEVLGRRISPEIVSRSLAIILIAGTIVGVFLTLLLATQNIPFDRLFFETVSAFGTVGLSINTTGLLNNTGKILIIFVMYVGRIGPLTLALAVGEKKLAQGYQYPKGSMAVG
jgi:trk system potassium uptake protein TrkH